MATHGTPSQFGYIDISEYIYTQPTDDATYDGYDTSIAGKASTASVAGKEPTITAGTVSQYFRGDKTWQTLPSKRVETYSGTSDASGNYTVSYTTAFGSTPDVQPQIQASGSSDTRTIRITASSTTGFTVNVRNRNEVLGLLPTYTNVQSISVSVLVTER